MPGKRKRFNRILVTGGAGYLGAHVVLALADQGRDVTVVDDLSTGHRLFVEYAEHFVRLDIRDRSALEALLSRRPPDVVIHLAGKHDAHLSYNWPERVFEIDVGGTAVLLAAMRAANVRRIAVRGSLCVYGDPEEIPVSEETPLRPVSPYAHAMAAVETLLDDSARSWSLQPRTLRLAHLGGADDQLRAGPLGRGMFDPVSRLLRAARNGPRNTPFLVSKQILDVIHVADAAAAFVAVVEAFERECELPSCFNVSTGCETQLGELVKTLTEISNRDIPVAQGRLPRGNPAKLTASSDLFRGITGWKPVRSTPRKILESAWAYVEKREIAPGA